MGTKHHGELKQASVDNKPREVIIPQALRSQVIWYNKYTHAEAVAHYGIWRMKALRPLPGNDGETIQPGETFSIVGNSAVEMAYNRDAEFNDPNLEKEFALKKELEALTRKPVRVGELEAFQPAAQAEAKKPGWRD